MAKNKVNAFALLLVLALTLAVIVKYRFLWPVLLFVALSFVPAKLVKK